MTPNTAPEKSMAVSFQQAACSWRWLPYLVKGVWVGQFLLLSAPLPSVHHAAEMKIVWDED